MSAQRLRVDWPRCDERGLCHELLPELVSLDEWGYPIVRGPVEPAQRAAARTAVASCPRLAVRLGDQP